MAAVAAIKMKKITLSGGSGVLRFQVTSSTATRGNHSDTALHEQIHVSIHQPEVQDNPQKDPGINGKVKDGSGAPTFV